MKNLELLKNQALSTEQSEWIARVTCPLPAVPA